MKQFLYISAIIGFTAVFTSGCVKERSFPPEPVIEFLEYVSYSPDSADCLIKFRDGDGDIGIMSGDFTSEDDFKMKYLFKDTDGVFRPFDANPSTTAMDTLYYSYRVPNLTPEGQYKALDGTIRAKLRSAPLYAPGHSVVKFEITLRDRAGNRSNVVSTEEITVP